MSTAIELDEQRRFEIVTPKQFLEKWEALS